MKTTSRLLLSVLLEGGKPSIIIPHSASSRQPMISKQPTPHSQEPRCHQNGYRKNLKAALLFRILRKIVVRNANKQVMPDPGLAYQILKSKHLMQKPPADLQASNMKVYLIIQRLFLKISLASALKAGSPPTA